MIQGGKKKKNQMNKDWDEGESGIKSNIHFTGMLQMIPAPSCTFSPSLHPSIPLPVFALLWECITGALRVEEEASIFCRL